jgi:hypothetical protein
MWMHDTERIDGMSLQLYLFTRPKDGYVNWDEYGGAVIAASDPGEANRIMFNLENSGREWECMILANEIDPTIKEGVVLSDHRMG